MLGCGREPTHYSPVCLGNGLLEGNGEGAERRRARRLPGMLLGVMGPWVTIARYFYFLVLAIPAISANIPIIPSTINVHCEGLTNHVYLVYSVYVPRKCFVLVFYGRG